MVVEQAELEQAACMVAELVVGALAPPAAAVEMLVELLAESALGRIAPLAGLVAVGEDPVQVLCPTWGLARGSTCRRPLTSMSELAVILTRFDPEEISLASSQVVVC